MADIIITTSTLKDKNPSYWTGGTPSAPYLCPTKSALTSYFVSGAITVKGTYTDKLLVCEKDVSAVTRSVTGTTTEYLNVSIKASSLENASGQAVSGNMSASGGKWRAKAIVTYLQRTKTTYNYGNPSYTSWENKSATIYGSYVEGKHLGTTIKNRTELGTSTPSGNVAGATRTGNTITIYLEANVRNASFKIESCIFKERLIATASPDPITIALARVQVRGYYTSGSAGSLYTATTYESTTYSGSSANSSTVKLVTDLGTTKGDLLGKGLKVTPAAFTAQSNMPTRDCATGCKVVITNPSIKDEDNTVIKTTTTRTFPITGSSSYTIYGKVSSPSSGSILLQRGMLIVKVAGGASSGSGIAIAQNNCTSVNVSGPNSMLGWNACGGTNSTCTFYIYPLIYYYTSSGRTSTTGSVTVRLLGNANIASGGTTGTHNKIGRTTNSTSGPIRSFTLTCNGNNVLVDSTYFP